MLYNFGQGVKNIWRNKLFSLASIATMSACIFLFGIFYSIGTNFSSMVQSAEESVAITVFFVEGVTQEQIDAVEAEIQKRPEVESYNFVSAEEAWESFKLEYFAGKEELAEGFADDNPLENSANFEIYMNDVSLQSALVAYLEDLDGVREVNQSEVAAETLADFSTLLAYISAGVVFILVAVAAFLINNTVTVGIHVRDEEIKIMKLIGAKDKFVRSPFIVEGVLIGLIGSIIPLVLLYFLYEGVVSYVAEKFNVLGNFISFIPVEQLYTVLVPISLILGVGIGFVGSRFTVAKHLR